MIEFPPSPRGKAAVNDTLALLKHGQGNRIEKNCVKYTKRIARLSEKHHKTHKSQ
jgi:hypothetical protein